ncbi:angiogenic factor with G patch and FHA domains 1-like isoform X1 [Haliotis cracherodii]|uniref:angiogenic factor with G patch and FHA domains 1-like isoform X1 n=1 Tax=Haliotis cracherodii TaxID=6455 RepID=UPI0039E9C2E0
MAGDDMEIETLKTKVLELEAELSAVKQELEDAHKEIEKGAKALEKKKRQLETANTYNDDLREQMTALSREIQDFRDKWRTRKEIGLQAVAEEILTELGDKPLPSWENGGTTTLEGTDKPVSIAEALKLTAEATLSQSGFVFDDNSGLYYDYNSGYYYNHEQGLYYDPATGTYFYYEEASGEYKFHSQVEPLQYTCPPSQSQPRNPTAEPSGSKEKAKKKKSKDKRKREREETEQSRKKRKKEKDDKEKSKSRRRKSEKKKTKRKKHRSHHRRGGNSRGSEKDDMQSVEEPGSDSGRISRHHGDKERGRRERMADKDRKRSRHSKGRKKTVLEDSGKLSVAQKNQPESDVEMGEIVESSQEPPDMKSVESSSEGVVHLSDGEVLSDSFASGRCDLEPGELTSDTESSSTLSSISESSVEEEEEEEIIEEEQEEVSTNWPPCIRVMVTESDCLPEATLFIVTCDGASIGREKDMNNLIRIPDINVSKVHAGITYDYNLQSYVITDSGSQNGTFLNDARISQVKAEGTVVSHGDILQVGNTTLSLHIHPGSDTCDECEPGQVLARLQAEEKAKREVKIVSRADRLKEHRQQLKQIKRRYGLENCAYIDNTTAINNPAYEDKAASRRRTVGSDNPHAPDEAPASVMQPISTENKGRKLLAKMGWKEGQGLGKDNTGIAEPINVMLRTNQAAGLGSGAAVQKSLDDVQTAGKSRRWLQAQQRYNKLDNQPVDLSKPTNMTLSFKKGPTVNLQPRVDLGAGESDEDGDKAG